MGLLLCCPSCAIGPDRNERITPVWAVIGIVSAVTNGSVCRWTPQFVITCDTPVSSNTRLVSGDFHVSCLKLLGLHLP